MQTLLQRNLDHYDALESKAEILFNALDSLSMGRLNHHIVSASDLTSYLKHVEEVIQEEYPQLAIEEINKYYEINFVSFMAYDSTLFVHVPIYLNLKNS